MHGGVMVREQQDRDREQQDAGTQRGRVGWGGEKRGPVLMKKLNLSLFNSQTQIQLSNLVNFSSTLF